ncbi:LysR family transcriptional regulator [Paraburkholderia caledonica]|uniref:LysR family transcriptional regulator n=1 Tax=Paraburkholderia caledonica TaxID=134536 RepID=UPI0004849854|nr:LysR substrate-binding domain-containing protein [Paraburkholderia caledonica]
MELDLLRSFLALAETLNFGKASSALHLSQPALSRRIGKLEEELGGPVFSRGRQGARLTELGKSFATDARQLIQGADEVLKRAQRLASGEIGELRIGFGFWAITIVTTAVPRFRSHYPEVRIQLNDCSSAEQLLKLKNGLLDIAFMRMVADTSLQQHAISRDSLAFVVPHHFPLPDNAINAKSVKGTPFVMIAPDRAPDFYQSAMDFLRQNQLDPSIVQEANEFHSIQALVAAGLGISLVPASTAKLSIEGLQLRIIPASKKQWKLGVAIRRGETQPAVRRFVELLERD